MARRRLALVVLVRQAGVAGDQVVAQAEELDLLRRGIAGRHVAEVVELPALGGPAVEEGVAEPGEVGLAEEAREHGQPQQQQEPRVEGEQRGHERGEGERALAHAEQERDEGEPTDGLSPGPLQVVVELRVLEVLQVERGGVLHQPHAHAVAEKVAEQRLHERRRPLHEVEDERQGQLESHQPRQPTPVRVRRTEVRHHRIDDELPHPQQRHGTERTQEAQRHHARRGPRVHLPDQLQEGREQPQRSQSLPEGRPLIGVVAGSASTRHPVEDPAPVPRFLARLGGRGYPRPAAALSAARMTASTRSSAPGAATTCTAIGVPSGCRATGTTPAGAPARFQSAAKGA